MEKINLKDQKKTNFKRLFLSSQLIDNFKIYYISKTTERIRRSNLYIIYYLILNDKNIWVIGKMVSEYIQNLLEKINIYLHLFPHPT